VYWAFSRYLQFYGIEGVLWVLLRSVFGWLVIGSFVVIVLGRFWFARSFFRKQPFAFLASCLLPSLLGLCGTLVATQSLNIAS
jgi:hypothetical protein